MTDVAEKFQLVHEDIQSIIHEQSEPMYDSYLFEGSMGQEDQLVDSHDDIV